MTRSRRWFLSTVRLGCVASAGGRINAQRTKPASSTVFRYKDLSTEFQILRLTDPAFTSRLPAHYGRALPRRGNFLLYASDVTGRMEAFRMESKGAVSPSIDRAGGAGPGFPHLDAG